MRIARTCDEWLAGRKCGRIGRACLHDMIPGTTYAKSASDRMGIVTRKMEEAEYHLLRGFLYEAIFIPEGAAVPPEVIVDSPELQVYYVGFGTSKHDRALVAEAEGRVVGAV